MMPVMMSNMSVQVKHARVSSLLAEEIIGGSLTPGSRLPGEHELAARFDVSRGTIRQALARLEADGLIEKHPGAGSFVSFQGHRLDERLGWSRALAAHGVQTTAEMLRLERVRLPELAAELGIDLRGLQLLLGEISGLEIGSLRIESPRDGREEDLC